MRYYYKKIKNKIFTDEVKSGLRRFHLSLVRNEPILVKQYISFK